MPLISSQRDLTWYMGHLHGEDKEVPGFEMDLGDVIDSDEES